MELNHLNLFNESFLSIDINKIKEEAFKFHKTSECREILSQIDQNVLEKVIKEVEKLSNKYKSIEVAIKKIISKSQASNEGIIGMSILTIFGLHAFIKLLIALRDNHQFGDYIDRLFHAGEEKQLKGIRNFLISVTFIVYMIIHIVASNCWNEDTYISKLYNTNLKWQWSGVNNYKVKDGTDKIYLFKKSGDKFDIYHNDTLIGRCKDENLFNLKDKLVLRGIDTSSINTSYPNSYLPTIKIDLEKLLLGKYKLNIKTLSYAKQREIDIRNLEKEAKVKSNTIALRNKELNQLKHKIDSIDKTRYNIYENVDATRKFLLSKGIDYDLIDDLQTGNYTMDNKIRAIRSLKASMLRDNKMGYLSTFVKYVFQSYSTSYILSLYNELMRISNMQLISKLRNSNGVLTNVVDFENWTDLNRAIIDVYQWKELNAFIKGFPPKQRNLIWENGYYKADLLSISEYLTKSIIDISYSKVAKDAFFSKISSIKDKDTLIEVIYAVSKTEPWDYDYWLKKLKSTKNTLITWSSKEEKEIICLVFTHPAIQKIAYMTSWCIFTNKNTFYSYLQKGYQFILYDFKLKMENDRSIIGFTTDLNHNMLDCHSRRDMRDILPNKFVTEYKRDKFQLKSEFIKIDLREALRKLNPVVMPLFRRRIGDIISNNKYINNFLNWYE